MNVATNPTKAASNSTQGKKVQQSRKKQTSTNKDIRSRMISEAAYYKALHRNFSNGSAEQDWYVAEVEIDKMLNAANK